MIEVFYHFDGIMVRCIGLDGFLGDVPDQFVPGQGEGSCPDVIALFCEESVVFGVFVFLHFKSLAQSVP